MPTQYLSREEVNALLKVYLESPDLKAVNRAGNRLVSEHMPMIVKIARSHSYKGRVDEDDLIQECCIGFLQALKKYDVERNVKLATYAWNWVTAFATKYAYRARRRQKREPSIETQSGTRGPGTLNFGLQVTVPPPSLLYQIAEKERYVQENLKHFEKSLDERDKTVLDLRLLADKPAPLGTVGDLVGLSREGVRQRQLVLLKKLRKNAALRRANAY